MYGLFRQAEIHIHDTENTENKMKKNITKILVYIGCFIVLFLLGATMSDLIIFVRAKYLLHIADSLNFEKDIGKVYPVLPPEKNGFTELEKVYNALDELPAELKALDSKMNLTSNVTASDEEQKKFWESPAVSEIANSLPSIPYTTRFDLGIYNSKNKIRQNLKIIRRLHNFYINYLKFSAAHGDKLQILLVFQKLITINRALEQQNLASCEDLRQELWISALDTLVHYGPTEKRYEEYYLSLQRLVQSLDFKYCPHLTIKYNNLFQALNNPVKHEGNFFRKHTLYINSIKEFTKEFRTALMQYPLPPDLKRNPPLAQDTFFKQKSVTQAQLQILMHLKMYQLKNNFYPEAIEGFPAPALASELIYKRISPNDFVLKRKSGL